MSSHVMHANIIGHFKEIPDGHLHTAIYKSLDRRLQRTVSISKMDDYIFEKMKFYHPFWISTMQVTYDRGLLLPFKIETVYAFVDAVSGYRDRLPKAWPVSEDTFGNVPVVDRVIETKEAARPYFIDLQNRWSRSYVGERPKYEHLSLELAYMPMWMISLRFQTEHVSVIINGMTGVGEEELAARWAGEEWHRL
ncbi:hypothetical protein JCM19037_4792 [Geomicrobium sp. JCM 19037]|uniref:hypothetical protein n=1 Tax=Geomicrobium sp. JCM 19037 TaxID=1460634 RepID=UPI00045F2F62|nr:hypothetical protein [Geomicrobium sp. JCM 19037]GAK06212.1 hypothetical protein JCM19037_4792 [Geomicrobium sp. JCM 19037]